MPRNKHKNVQTRVKRRKVRDRTTFNSEVKYVVNDPPIGIDGAVEQTAQGFGELQSLAAVKKVLAARHVDWQRWTDNQLSVNDVLNSACGFNPPPVAYSYMTRAQEQHDLQQLPGPLMGCRHSKAPGEQLADHNTTPSYTAGFTSKRGTAEIVRVIDCGSFTMSLTSDALKCVDNLYDYRDRMMVWILMQELLRNKGKMIFYGLADFLGRFVKAAAFTSGKTSDDVFLPSRKDRNLFNSLMQEKHYEEALDMSLRKGFWFFILEMTKTLREDDIYKLAEKYYLPESDCIETISGEESSSHIDTHFHYLIHIALFLGSSLYTAARKLQLLKTLSKKMSRDNSRGYASQFCFFLAFGHVSIPKEAFHTMELDRGDEFKEIWALPYDIIPSQSIYCAEIFEYCKFVRDQNFVWPVFQEYKLLYVRRLIEQKHYMKAAGYCDSVGQIVESRLDLFRLPLMKELLRVQKELKEDSPLLPVRKDGSLFDWVPKLKSHVREKLRAKLKLDSNRPRKPQLVLPYFDEEVADTPPQNELVPLQTPPVSKKMLKVKLLEDICRNLPDIM